MEIKIQRNSDSYIETFMKKIQSRLRDIEIKTEVKHDTIEFVRTVRTTTHSGENKLDAMNIFREGSVRIEKADSNRVQIFWEIKLDTLLFLCTVIGIVTGLISGLTGCPFMLSILIGLLGSIIGYAIGYSIVKIKIDLIVESSL